MHCAGLCPWSVIDGSPFFPSVGNRGEQSTSSQEYKEPGGLYYERPLHHCISGTRGPTLPKLQSTTQALLQSRQDMFLTIHCW